MKALLARLFAAVPRPLMRAAVGALNARFNISVVGVFFAADGRVLILRHVFRRQYPWGLPAGFLKAGETPAEAAVREVKEETGLDVAVTGIIAVHPVRPRHMEVVVAGTAAAGQVIRPSHEIFEGAFVMPHALPVGMMPSQSDWVRRAAKPAPALITEA